MRASPCIVAALALAMAGDASAQDRQDRIVPGPHGVPPRVRSTVTIEGPAPSLSDLAMRVCLPYLRTGVLISELGIGATTDADEIISREGDLVLKWSGDDFTFVVLEHDSDSRDVPQVGCTAKRSPSPVGDEADTAAALRAGGLSVGPLGPMRYAPGDRWYCVAGVDNEITLKGWLAVSAEFGLLNLHNRDSEPRRGAVAQASYPSKCEVL